MIFPDSSFDLKNVLHPFLKGAFSALSFILCKKWGFCLACVLSCVPQKWGEGIGMKILALNEARSFVRRFVCFGREEGKVWRLVNFWSTTLEETVKWHLSDLVVPVAHVPGRVCHFDGKTFNWKGKSILRMLPAKKSSRCGSKEKKYSDRLPAALKGTFLYGFWFVW